MSTTELSNPHIPLEIWQEILGHASHRDYLSLLQLSRAWSRFLQTSHFPYVENRVVFPSTAPTLLQRLKRIERAETGRASEMWKIAPWKRIPIETCKQKSIPLSVFERASAALLGGTKMHLTKTRFSNGYLALVYQTGDQSHGVAELWSLQQDDMRNNDAGTLDSGCLMRIHFGRISNIAVHINHTHKVLAFSYNDGDAFGQRRCEVKDFDNGTTLFSHKYAAKARPSDEGVSWIANREVAIEVIFPPGGERVEFGKHISFNHPPYLHGRHIGHDIDEEDFANMWLEGLLGKELGKTEHRSEITVTVHSVSSGKELFTHTFLAPECIRLHKDIEEKFEPQVVICSQTNLGFVWVSSDDGDRIARFSLTDHANIAYYPLAGIFADVPRSVKFIGLSLTLAGDRLYIKTLQCFPSCNDGSTSARKFHFSPIFKHLSLPDLLPLPSTAPVFPSFPCSYGPHQFGWGLRLPYLYTSNELSWGLLRPYSLPFRPLPIPLVLTEHGDKLGKTVLSEHAQKPLSSSSTSLIDSLEPYPDFRGFPNPSIEVLDDAALVVNAASGYKFIVLWENSWRVPRALGTKSNEHELYQLWANREWRWETSGNLSTS